MLNDYEIQRNEKYNKVISLLKLVASSLAIYCILLIIPNVFQEIYEVRNRVVEEPLKIRVIANSNTKADQNFKEELVENLSPFFLEIQRNEELQLSHDEVLQNMASYVEQQYHNEDIHIELGDHVIPPKLGDNRFYPQAVYHSLVVTIGQGRGDNFWCSLFPNVCEAPTKKDEKQDKEAKEEKEAEEVEEETEVTFILWEWIKKLFS